MKKLIAIILAAASILLLAGCGETTDIPADMQLVSGSDEAGYYFFAPEEWKVSNLGGVSAAYISAVNTTSVTFTEISADKLTYDSAVMSAEEYFLHHYFEDSKDEFPTEPTVTMNGEEKAFGVGDTRADKAVAYAYTYKYADVSYGFLQYFVVHNNSYYILTYTAINEVMSGYETSRYDEYMTSLESIVSNFRFVNKTGTSTEGEAIPEGYRLVTEKSHAGFEFYAHSDFATDYVSAIVSVTAKDGSNVTMTEATAVGTTADAYMKERLEELGAIAENVTPAGQSVPAADSDVTIVGVATKLGNNSSWAFAYEYTYEYNGEKYHVYQILAVDGVFIWQDGYVFTYTAKEENYTEHFDEVKAMIEKVVF